MKSYREITQVVQNELRYLVDDWVPKLLSLDADIIKENRNSQERNIKQILGHMIDSASNNTHRIIHLQYGNKPLLFPDYANHGMNDVWIRIQNYEEENWENMIYLWKFIHLHLIHVISNSDGKKANNKWISGTGEEISMSEMILDFPLHFKLHLSEIENLIK